MTAVDFYTNGLIFDGARLHSGWSARFEDGHLAALGPDIAAGGGKVIDLAGDILSPGYVDLQVNGGGGLLLNDDPSPTTLQRITRAHRRLGTVALLPTLITDTPDKTRAAIDATVQAVANGQRGVLGLHLEGPHLDQKRKGAHDAALIRPMQTADLDLYLAAARALPRLKLTIAPESASVDQIRRLTKAGVLISLGHSDCDYDTACRYADAGASCVTHMFNAMSPLSSRAPGLVGAALDHPGLSAGLIADGVHVHPVAMRTAWAAKKPPGRIYLVTDAMAVAGTEQASFRLNGRLIRRAAGRLTLEDGTLAGADLDLTTALHVLVNHVGIELPEALRAVTTTPAQLAGAACGLRPGHTRLHDTIRIAADLSQLRQTGETQNPGTGPGSA